MNRTLDGATMVSLLQKAAAGWRAHKDELRNLDAILGDGDMGVTTELGSDALVESLAAAEGNDIGALLIECGRQVNRASPSTFGTLLASAFMQAGIPVLGRSEVRIAELALMGQGAIDGIKTRGHADVGDKTLLDSLVPAVEAFGRAIGDGADDATAVGVALEAARTGMEATGMMPARHGRASYRQNGGVGVQDAGATAMYYLVESFGRGLIELWNNLEAIQGEPASA